MKKILVIDDEVDVLTVMQSRLEQANFVVITAKDGVEGFALCQSERPDLILLDVMMPNMDGYEFVRQMKTDESIKTIPVIMVTAKRDLDDLFKIEGVDHYFTKPYDSDELISKIQEIVSG